MSVSDYIDGVAMRVCVGNYGSYTAGYLIDQWFDLPMTPQELDKRLKTMQAEAQRLTGSPCEEFYISDYDGYPLDGGWKSWGDLFNEYTPIESLNLMAAQLVTMTDDEIFAAAAYIGNQGSNITFDEAMNALLQADEAPYHDLGWGEYLGDDATYQALHDSTTSEEKYGYLCAENNPDLNALLESDTTIQSAFDYEKYGELCAALDGVTFLGDGYLTNDSMDLAYYSHDEIAETVLENLAHSDYPDLYEGFAQAASYNVGKEVFDELTAGHSFYSPAQGLAVCFVPDKTESATKRFVIVDVSPEMAQMAVKANADVGQFAYDAASEYRPLSREEVDRVIEGIGKGGSETGWYWGSPEVVSALDVIKDASSQAKPKPSKAAPTPKPKKPATPTEDAKAASSQAQARSTSRKAPSEGKVK